MMDTSSHSRHTNLKQATTSNPKTTSPTLTHSLLQTEAKVQLAVVKLPNLRKRRAGETTISFQINNLLSI